MKSGFKIGCLAIIIIGALAVAGNVLWFGGRTMDVVRQEIDPGRLLEKYEWFKDAAAEIDAKDANLKRYETKIAALESDYEGVARPEWARDDRQQLSLWKTELDGLAMNRNNLAAEYNAQMAKINYRFCNVGDLPRGAETPLPREFKPYIYE